MSDYPQVLVATLGGQPQIITLTLDLLLQANYPISEVFVIHPKAAPQSRLQQSLHRLNAEFNSDYYRQSQRTIHFHSCMLELKNQQPIHDISDDDHADGTLDTIHRLLGDLKRQGFHIHLSVSGGRRMIGLLAVSVASLNFDRHDNIWHIYTPDELQTQLQDGKTMHVPTDAGVKLIKGPFFALGAHFSTTTNSFRSAQEEQRRQMAAQEHARCTEVFNKATPKQREALQALARGLKPQQVADEMSITIVTVNTHKTALLGLCYNAWNIPNNETLRYHDLHTKFAEYFQKDSRSVTDLHEYNMRETSHVFQRFDDALTT